MAQQINLCAPILLTQKKHFSANTMAASLGVFVVLGGLLLATWSWSLHSAVVQYQDTMAAQARDIANLQAALARNKAAAQPPDAALLKQLDAQHLQLAQRRALLQALQEGALEPGKAYSDYLRFLSATVPAPVWITGVALAGGKFQVLGQTFEPAALNDWVARMATHPLLQGLQLSDVQVRSVGAARPSGAPSVASANAAPPPAGRPVWSFELLSTRPVAAAGPTSEPERKP